MTTSENPTAPEPRLEPTTVQAPAAPAQVPFDQRFDLRALAGLRSGVAAHGDNLGLLGDRLENLIIISSELAINAVRHGGGSGRLRLWRDGNLIFCQVSDRGRAVIPPGTGTRLPEPTVAGGRGLWLCRRLSDYLHIESSPHGSTVTAVIMLDGQA